MRTFWYATGLLSLTLSIAPTAHAQRPTPEEVGDADSFGRRQVYLGVVSVPGVALRPDCTPDPDFPLPPGARCVTLQPQPEFTDFDEANLAEIRLPALAARSLICFSITPFASVDFANETDTRQRMLLAARTNVTIENAVLNDPELIDPSTGEPYGGRITFPFGFANERRTLDPGEEQGGTIQQSRDCIGGLISRSALIGLGLSEAKATEFFRTPMRLEFGTAGNTSLLRSGFIFYGMRLYGDR